MTKKELLSKIKPEENGYSDKYSWQLYQFVKRNGCIKVYYNLKADEPYDLNVPRWNRIYICKNTCGDIIGNSLVAIQSPSKDKYSLFSYDDSNGYNLIDATDEFWDMYIHDGRCVLDRTHTGWWNGSGDRFDIIDENTKRCTWCGQILKKEVVTITTEKEVWK